MSSRRGVWLGTLFFLGFWLLLLVAGRSRFFRDPGTFWHTVVGERILTRGFFDADPFTFTFHGKKWIPHQWLGEVGMALVHRVGGLDSLLVVATGVLATIFAWLTVRMWRTGLHPVVAVGVVALALAASASHFHIRPHLATMAGVVLTMALLADAEAGRASLRRLWWLVPIFWVWSNTHGGVLGGFAMLGLCGAGWVLSWVFGRSSPVRSARSLLEVAAIGVLCGASAFATPYGAEIPRTWLDIMNAPLLPTIIQEHAATDFRQPKSWPLLGIAGVYLFVLVGTKPRDWRVAWFLPLFWMVQAYSRVRHGPLFAMAAVVAVADVWPHTRWAAWLVRKRPDFYKSDGVNVVWGWQGPLIAAGLVGLALILHAANVHLPVVGKGWAKLDSKYWPTEMTETLRQYEPSQGGGRLFNDYIDGGFVIYHTPGYHVFVDDRCELFGDEWLVRFVKAGSENSAPAIEGWEREFGPFDFALTRTDTPFDAHFRSHPEAWESIRTTPTAAFYKRK